MFKRLVFLGAVATLIASRGIAADPPRGKDDKSERLLTIAESPADKRLAHEGVAVDGLRLEVKATVTPCSPSLNLRATFVNETDRPILIHAYNLYVALSVARISPADAVRVRSYPAEMMCNLVPPTRKDIVQIPPKGRHTVSRKFPSEGLSLHRGKLTGGKLIDFKKSHFYEFQRSGKYTLVFVYRPSYRNTRPKNMFPGLLRDGEKLHHRLIYSQPITIDFKHRADFKFAELKYDFRSRAGSFYEKEYLQASAESLIRAVDDPKLTRDGATRALHGLIYDFLDAWSIKDETLSANAHAAVIEKLDQRIRVIVGKGHSFERYMKWRQSRDRKSNPLEFLIHPVPGVISVDDEVDKPEATPG